MPGSAPVVRFASAGGARIAYMHGGHGRPVLHVGNWVTHNDTIDFVPALRDYYQGLWSLSEAAFVEMPGSGGSDPLGDNRFGRREDWVAALEAVLDDLEWEAAVLIGWDSASHPALAFAATRPTRTEGLILAQPYVRSLRSDDFPLGATEAEAAVLMEYVLERHGTAAYLAMLTPSGAADSDSCEGWARWQRAAATPSVARLLHSFELSLDSRAYLSQIDAPTLLIETAYPFGRNQGEYMAEAIFGGLLA